MVTVMLKKSERIQQVYNDGLIKFHSMTQAEDEFGTPILDETKQLELSLWFRRIGSRAEDIYYARSLGQDIDIKVALRGNIYIDTKWTAEIDKSYTIYQTDYNPKNNETIVSLKEVRDE